MKIKSALLTLAAVLTVFSSSAYSKDLFRPDEEPAD